MKFGIPEFVLGVICGAIVLFGLLSIFHNSVWKPPEVQVKEVKTLIITLPKSYYEHTDSIAVTWQKALEYLREARFTHQYLVDNPAELSRMEKQLQEVGFTCGLENEKEWVKRYDQIINLIICLVNE